MTQRRVYYNSLRNGDVFRQESNSGIRVLTSRIHKSYCDDRDRRGPDEPKVLPCTEPVFEINRIKTGTGLSSSLNFWPLKC